MITITLLYLTSLILFSTLHNDLVVNGFVQVIHTSHGKITVNTTLLKIYNGMNYDAQVPTLTPTTLTPESRQICTQTCQAIPDCASYTYRLSNGACKFFATTPSIEHYGLSENNNFILYELENACIRNPGVCEHGSECVPHLNNGSYYCRWCLEPFRGRHCNETDEPGYLPKSEISQDILDGKKSSCKNLKKYYDKSGVRDIHPWRDERKIKVRCENSQMRVTNIWKCSGFLCNYNGYYGSLASVTVTDYDDLEPGLDLSTGAFRVSTTFLDKLYKLVKFRSMAIACKLAVSGSYERRLSFEFNSESNKPVLRYLLGHTDTLPDVTDDYSNNPDILPNGIQDGKFSDAAVPYEERYSNELIKFNNGKVLSFASSKYGCFSDPDTDIDGDYEVHI